jgi:hypothetical protein
MITRPALTSDRDAIKLSDEMESRRKKDNYTQSMIFSREPGFSHFIGWCGVVCGVLVTSAIIWGASAIVSLESEMVGVQRDIVQLLSRPAGVPRDEYNRDLDHIYNDLGQIKRQLDDRRIR